MAWTKTDDGSIVDQNGRVIFFSTKRFIDDICLGNCCFICGADPTEKEFNDEHVFPEWLLRKYDLFARTITLPNGRKVRYDRHTVPCCVECNSLMGKTIEKPMSAVVNGGPDSIQNHVAANGALELFVWMGLIYLKLHLKNKTNRKILDTRVPGGMIADDYEWDLLHHIHTVVRCFYIPTMIEAQVFGSLLVLPCRQEGSPDEFDFGDLHIAQTMMLRLGRTAIFIVFNDSTGALSFFRENMLDKITGPISELQAREIMTEFAMLNLHLKERPIYQSELDTVNEQHRIIARLPDRPELEDWNYEVRGKLMWNAFGHAWPQLRFAGTTEEEVKEVILTGKLTVLFDDIGNFVSGPANL
ncbi:hypothetical protein QA640_09800 [Bradyrhizobium sp. CB82]|uniref:hypothetical protein n=1 Tax=Bradyrhizobium sp. CB82 TaxID=3039159 RepID=UPI0024B0914E|nr:hypothetical protein [Bradyrhizobium sp. CB82]WFU42721.1 hypothetical protein QA640_09800 [Bradyrhizobium sp. CB82]